MGGCTAACYEGSLIVALIQALLLLIADMEMAVYEKSSLKGDCWRTRLSVNYTGWGGGGL